MWWRGLERCSSAYENFHRFHRGPGFGSYYQDGDSQLSLTTWFLTFRYRGSSAFLGLPWTPSMHMGLTYTYRQNTLHERKINLQNIVGKYFLPTPSNLLRSLLKLLYFFLFMKFNTHIFLSLVLFSWLPLTWSYPWPKSLDCFFLAKFIKLESFSCCYWRFCCCGYMVGYIVWLSR